jgi:hypothetical protein
MTATSDVQQMGGYCDCSLPDTSVIPVRSLQPFLQIRLIQLLNYPETVVNIFH